MSDNNLSNEQKEYLAGFAYGADVARAVRGLPVLSDVAAAGTTISLGGTEAAGKSGPVAPEQIAVEAQQRFLAEGKTLCNEERAKLEKNPLDMWDEISERAAQKVFPKGTDTFLTKFHGLFYVAPAQDAYMCRLRIPAGELQSHQLHGLAQLSDASANGKIDITTRANLQLREIPAGEAMQVLYTLRELDIVNLGSGGDNIRNVTASPLSGIDPDELIETIPLAKRMHHYILNHRAMYGLPRKFNIAFDGGGRIGSLQDTNDVGFEAVEVESAGSSDVEAGVYFRLNLGGITGHHDFARDTGVFLKPQETIEVAGAIVRVFVRTGDRTDRKKARLKYVLDEMGFDAFLRLVEEELGWSLRRIEDAMLKPRCIVEDRWAHVGVHPQKQAGKVYVGLVVPVGKLTSDQARGISELARKFGSGRICLTVWQNLLIPDVEEDELERVLQRVNELGLEADTNSVRAGLVACTGNAGCKFAGADTKRHAIELAHYVEQRLDLDSPVNIHVTGCHHSCAQHYIGDIGLIATQVEVGEETVDGYHIHLGGGWGENQAMGRLVFESVAAQDLGPLITQVLRGYIERRESSSETFAQFAARTETDAFKAMADAGFVVQD